MRINFTKFSAGNHKLKFINELIRLFALDNDIKKGTAFTNFISSPQGSKALAKWAQNRGYKISFWCMESYKQPNTVSGNVKYEEIFIGFGIDIDETCEKIVELKLKT